jgi:nicotinate-nucleotide adenylyltransferase
VFFIVGEDSIPELPTWREPARIVQLARVVAVNRPGSRAAFRLEDYPGVPPGVVERMERDRVRMEPSPLESRAIRAAIREGRPITGMVPGPVAAYILAHGLYRT